MAQAISDRIRHIPYFSPGHALGNHSIEFSAPASSLAGMSLHLRLPLRRKRQEGVTAVGPGIRRPEQADSGGGCAPTRERRRVEIAEAA
jgi:hypothetical protein